MQYTITLNQKNAYDLGLNLTQALLILCIKDLQSIPYFEKNEKHEVWITHSKFLEEFPLLPFNNRVSLFNSLKKLEELGFITKTQDKNAGNKCFYGITYKGSMLTNINKVVNEDLQGVVNEDLQGSLTKININNNTNNNKPINNSSSKREREELPPEANPHKNGLSSQQEHSPAVKRNWTY